MTWRGITLAGYLLVAFAAVALESAARRPGTSVPTVGAVVSRIMSTRSGRVALVVGWAWVGMHFLAL